VVGPGADTQRCVASPLRPTGGSDARAVLRSPSGPATAGRRAAADDRSRFVRPLLRAGCPVSGYRRYLAIQSIIVAIWMGLNVAAVAWRFDPYPFILLNLVFSAQAAYAAPLILLAQSRQADRDRISLGEDRNRAERTKADTDFLARELAALRIAIGEAGYPGLPTR
jgi:uncharacterized membrane protein